MLSLFSLLISTLAVSSADKPPQQQRLCGSRSVYSADLAVSSADKPPQQQLINVAHSDDLWPLAVSSADKPPQQLQCCHCSVFLSPLLQYPQRINPLSNSACVVAEASILRILQYPQRINPLSNHREDRSCRQIELLAVSSADKPPQQHRAFGNLS